SLGELMEMVLGKRQKALIVVFVLGLVALTADRVFLRPQGGAESVSGAEAGNSPLEVRDSAAASPGDEQRPTVAQRLDRVWSDQEVNDVGMRDPFSLEGSWLARPEKDSPDVPSLLAAFARAHPLGAVIMDGRQSYALVNDRVLKLGDQIDGFTLVSVGPKSAVFDRQGEQVVLELVTK
ncbi:MAG: hypothetical protein JW955_24115, partial [Sedimentisphaerales bacterium]|nr:hypothetical protein [Sedimentisphaerales bacterium]